MKFCCFTVRWKLWVFVHVCVCVCVYTYTNTQIMRASQLNVNFHYVLRCWLLRYMFIIFCHLIWMSFLFLLCFNYSLLLNNADRHSTDNYTRLAFETNFCGRIFLRLSITFLDDFSGESIERSLDGRWMWSTGELVTFQKKNILLGNNLVQRHFPTTNPTRFALELK
jgi:hypothetical protein